jgi:hypothetical protein
MEHLEPGAGRVFVFGNVDGKDGKGSKRVKSMTGGKDRFVLLRVRGVEDECPTRILSLLL